MNGAITLDWWQLALAAMLLVAPASISIGLKLGLEKTLGIAALRTVLQLGLLGLVLEWVFALDRWYFVLPVLLFMFFGAARAAVSRSSRRFEWVHLFAFGSLVLATSVVSFVATEVIIGVEPWWRPQYLIPLLGMLLGNGLNGISLSLDRLLAGFVGQRDAIEARLALGASLWVAIRPGVREAVRTGMIPIINTMTIVGIVSLPGMMTGQILAGARPADAVAYQILIMFMIASSTATGTILLVLASARMLAHPEARIRWDRIVDGPRRR